MRYRAPAAAALLTVELDAFTAVFHRASGITHLLVSPAPEILALLDEAEMDAPTLLTALGDRFDLGDADPMALAARLDELVGAGLVEVA